MGGWRSQGWYVSGTTFLAVTMKEALVTYKRAVSSALVPLAIPCPRPA
jgi:hypothetical protein